MTGHHPRVLRKPHSASTQSNKTIAFTHTAGHIQVHAFFKQQLLTKHLLSLVTGKVDCVDVGVLWIFFFL